jgi:hypothetical protein
MTSIQMLYDCTNDDDLFSHADIEHKLLFFIFSDTQTNYDQTIKEKKCQDKLDTYVQSVHRKKMYI